VFSTGNASVTVLSSEEDRFQEIDGMFQQAMDQRTQQMQSNLDGEEGGFDDVFEFDSKAAGGGGGGGGGIRRRKRRRRGGGSSQASEITRAKEVQEDAFF